MINKKLLLLSFGLFTTSQMIYSQIPSYVPSNGLFSYWPCNGNANDQSASDNNGTFNGANLTTDRTGDANKADSFDGINDQINVIGSNFGTSAFSISGWFEMSTTQNQNFLDIKQIFIGGYSNSNKTAEIPAFKENNDFKLLGNILEVTAFDETVISPYYMNNNPLGEIVFCS